jgi:hypothetical protein
MYRAPTGDVVRHGGRPYTDKRRRRGAYGQMTERSMAAMLVRPVSTMAI